MLFPLILILVIFLWAVLGIWMSIYIPHYLDDHMPMFAVYTIFGLFYVLWAFPELGGMLNCHMNGIGCS